MTSQDVVFLFDVDNRLVDNDRVQNDLRKHLERESGPENRSRYWAISEQLRAELGYADYLGALSATGWEPYCSETALREPLFSDGLGSQRRRHRYFPSRGFGVSTRHIEGLTPGGRERVAGFHSPEDHCQQNTVGTKRGSCRDQKNVGDETPRRAGETVTVEKRLLNSLRDDVTFNVRSGVPGTCAAPRISVFVSMPSRMITEMPISGNQEFAEEVVLAKIQRFPK